MKNKYRDRRIWSDDQKREIVQDALIIGLQEAARKYDVVSSVIHAWKKKFNDRDANPIKDIILPNEHKKRTWSLERKKEIVRESQNIGTKEVSKKYNLNPTIVYRWRKAFGVSRMNNNILNIEIQELKGPNKIKRQIKKTHRVWDSFEKKEIAKESFQTSVRAVVNKYKVNPSMVYKWRREFTLYTRILSSKSGIRRDIHGNILPSTYDLKNAEGIWIGDKNNDSDLSQSLYAPEVKENYYKEILEQPLQIKNNKISQKWICILVFIGMILPIIYMILRALGG